MFKIIGLALGIKFGGLEGLVAGFILGYAFDEGIRCQIARMRYRKHARLSGRDQEDQLVLQTAFGLFAKFTKSDGPIRPEEIKAVEYLMQNAFQLTRRDKKQAIRYFNIAKDDSSTFYGHAACLQKIYAAHPWLLECYLDMLLLIATADGELNEMEDRLLLSATEIFCLPLEAYKAKREHYIQVERNHQARSEKPNGDPVQDATLAHCYSILRCTREVSDSELKQSYRKLVQDYHPDKIAAKELPEEFLRFANEKFRHIQNAYETIKAARGLA